MTNDVLGFDQLPTDVAMVLEILLREFERQSAFGPPDIEKYLTIVAEPYRAAVGEELQGIAREQDARRATSPDPPATVAYGALPITPGRAAGTAPYIPAGVPYQLGRVLGRGGFGVVYEAFDQSLGRTVALKVLRSPGGAGGDTIGTSSQRFRGEARRLARLRHEHIVQIHATDLDRNGVPYMVMEFVPRTLNDLIAERPGAESNFAEWPGWVGRIAVLTRDLAEAVAHAHEAGIIHGDLKPANVLLDGVRPKLADFGASRLRVLSGEEGSRGGAIGTPAFMAPEQIPGVGEVGERTDVYGLGAILYTCLTGRAPFPAHAPVGDEPPSTHTILQEVQTRNPRPVRELEPRAPAPLAAICEKCLAKNPGDRYASATELAEDLDRWLTHHAVKARPCGLFERTQLWRKRNVSRSMGRVLALLLAMVGVGTVAASLSFAKYQSDRVAEERRLNGELDAANTRLEQTNTRLEAENLRNSLHARALEEVGGPVIAATLIAHYDTTGFKQRSLSALEKGMRAFDAVPLDDLSPKTRRMVALGYIVLAYQEQEAGHADAAEALFRKAIPLLNRVITADADDRMARGELSNALYLLGAICRDSKQPEEWKKLWGESRRVSEALVADAADSEIYRGNLGRMYFNLGVMAMDEMQNAEAEKLNTKALEMLLPIAKPGSPNGWFVWGASNNRGELLAGRGDILGAFEDFVRSMRFSPDANERKLVAKEITDRFTQFADKPGAAIILARFYAVASHGAGGSDEWNAAAAKYIRQAVQTDGLWPTLAPLRHPDFAE